MSSYCVTCNDLNVSRIGQIVHDLLMHVQATNLLIWAPTIESTILLHATPDVYGHLLNIGSHMSYYLASCPHSHLCITLTCVSQVHLYQPNRVHRIVPNSNYYMCLCRNTSFTVKEAFCNETGVSQSNRRFVRT